MLLNLFNEMRAAKVPVSVRELLDLINALKQRVTFADMDEFYYLSRAILVKDEKHFDKFDRAFGAYFNGLEKLDDHLQALIPEDWLRKEFERSLSDEERAAIQSLGGLDKLIEEFKKRLEEQKERHAGGNKWIGTGGTSPFGSGGFNPEGIRVGDAGKRQGKAVKVWISASTRTSTIRWNWARAISRSLCAGCVNLPVRVPLKNWTSMAPSTTRRAMPAC
jgi:uncharacterized protein with von Willebrand factor type A (vWA) domain